MYKIKTAALLLLVLMTTVACGPSCSGLNPFYAPEEPLADSVDEAVALTVQADTGQQPTLSVDEIVAQTVAASSPEQATLSVDQIVAQTVAASAVQPAAPAAPDVAPDTNAPPVVADPNTASGTPQLRVSQNANVRNGPGTNYRVISTLAKDSVITVLAKTQNDSWYLIELPGGSKGWIANSVTDPVNAADMTKVQVAATIPAPPTSTPTATTMATATATATATAHSGATHTPTPHGHNPTHTPTPAITLISPTEVPSHIEIYNNSGTYICYVLTARSGESYGSNHLNGELAPGNSLYTTYPDAGPYDLYAQECEGYDDLYWESYNNFNDLYWELTPDGN